MNSSFSILNMEINSILSSHFSLLKENGLKGTQNKDR